MTSSRLPGKVLLPAGGKPMLAHLVARHVGYDGEIAWDTTKPNGQPRRMLDVSRAREGFGFEARVPFDEGIGRTVAWWETKRLAHGSVG